MKKGTKSKEVVVNTQSVEDKEAVTLLVELAGTRFWPAIRKFNRAEDANILATLASTDPFKEPTAMARAQGSRIGIYNLEKFINEELEKRKQKEKPVNSNQVNTGNFPGYGM